MEQSKNKWLGLAIILSAPLLSVVDIFIINVAIPAIKKGVHATDGEVQLVIAGYLLGYASFLITGGRAGDHLGRKKVFFWGMFSFIVASALCGISETAFQLNLTRFLQGVSASFMVPQTIAFIQVLFTDPKEKAKAISMFGITLGIAAVTGQILGGYLSDIHGVIEGWRLIFFINLPIGAVALWATHKYVTETNSNRGTRFDYTGIVILTVALFCLIYPLVEGREKGWPAWSIALLVMSIVMFVWFARNQRRKLTENRNPLIDIRLFRIKDFNIGLLAVLFHFMLHTSYLLLNAVYLQNGLGVSATDAGLYLLVPCALFAVSSAIGSRLMLRFGKRVLQVGAFFLAVTFLLQIVFLKPGVDIWLIEILLMIWGLSNGLVLPLLLNLAMKSVPAEYAGAAAGVYSTFQQTASALGVSIIGGIFFYFSKQGWQTGYAAGLVAILICVGLLSIMLVLLPEGKQSAQSSTASLVAE